MTNVFSLVARIWKPISSIPKELKEDANAHSLFHFVVFTAIFLVEPQPRGSGLTLTQADPASEPFGRTVQISKNPKARKKEHFFRAFQVNSGCY
jgi:hypothetical protein